MQQIINISEKSIGRTLCFNTHIIRDTYSAPSLAWGQTLENTLPWAVHHT